LLRETKKDESLLSPASPGKTDVAASTTKEDTEVNFGDDDNSDNNEISVEDRLNLLYTCARILKKLHRYREAARYLEQEAELTSRYISRKDDVTSRKSSNNKDSVSLTKSSPGDHLALSTLYHELAALYRNGIGNMNKALLYYQRALHVEMAAFRDLSSSSVLPVASSAIGRQQQPHPTHAQELQSRRNELLRHIQETKRKIGKMHFEIEPGNLDRAVQVTKMSSASRISQYALLAS